MKTKEWKSQFLIDIVKLHYSQGDEYYASLSDKGNWTFGYSNDYPMQHGSGKEYHLPNSILDIMIDQLNKR